MVRFVCTIIYVLSSVNLDISHILAFAVVKVEYFSFEELRPVFV
jgi:hypothetical protein